MADRGEGHELRRPIPVATVVSGTLDLSASRHPVHGYMRDGEQTRRTMKKPTSKGHSGIDIG